MVVDHVSFAALAKRLKDGNVTDASEAMWEAGEAIELLLARLAEVERRPPQMNRKER